MRRGPRDGDEFAEHLGLRWGEPGELRLTIRAGLVNNVGLLLGPVGFALVDYGMSAIVWDTLADDESTATISVAINFLGSASDGDVVCRSRIDRRGRQVAHTSAEVAHEDGRVLVTAIAGFAIRPAPRARR
jgi:uncharacterized protein (TIGR00369 family)